MAQKFSTSLAMQLTGALAPRCANLQFFWRVIAEKLAAMTTAFVTNMRPFFQEQGSLLADHINVRGNFLVGFHLLQEYRA